jgi:hypothetical protein
MTYSYTWRNKFLTMDAKSIDDMIHGLEQAVEQLKAMRADGVELAEGAEDDYAQLITTDPMIAQKYDFEEEEPDDMNLPDHDREQEHLTSRYIAEEEEVEA